MTKPSNETSRDLAISGYAVGIGIASTDGARRIYECSQARPQQASEPWYA